MLHQTLILVVKCLGEVRIHRFEPFYFSCSFTMFIDFVIIGMALVELAFPTRRFGRLRVFRQRRGHLLLRFFLFFG